MDVAYWQRIVGDTNMAMIIMSISYLLLSVTIISCTYILIRLLIDVNLLRKYSNHINYLLKETEGAEERKRAKANYSIDNLNRRKR